MAENIFKVYPNGSWYNDTPEERYNRVVDVISKYFEGYYDSLDVGWFIKNAIVNKIFISEAVYSLGNDAWNMKKTEKGNKLINEMKVLFNEQGYLSDKYVVSRREMNTKKVTFEHVVPFDVIKKILFDSYSNNELTFELFNEIRSKYNVCLVTLEENKKLNKHMKTMPKGWDWKTGDIFERYNIANVKIFKHDEFK